MSDSSVKSGRSPQVRAQNGEPQRAKYREFVLVLLLLFFLAILTASVIFIPADFITGDYDTPASKVIEFKQKTVAKILTAFGVWIGAGAAYFFGRQNFREAVEAMHDITLPPAEKVEEKNGGKEQK